MKTNGYGASADADRAFVPSGSSPQAVSPVPASIPSVGDRLYCAPTESRRGMPYWIVVKKVGRKWATYYREGSSSEYEKGRFDKDTLEIDSGNCTARERLYRSQEEYDISRQLGGAWGRVRRLVDRAYGRPKWLTLADLRLLEQLLTEPAQGMEAASADETRSGSAEGDSPVP